MRAKTPSVNEWPATKPDLDFQVAPTVATVHLGLEVHLGNAGQKEELMRLKLTGLTLAISILPLTANAQITVQMANIRCDQYLAMPPSQQEKFSAWMSG